MRKFHLLAVVVGAASLAACGGCAAVRQLTTPVSVTTVAEAEQATTLVMVAADTYVKTAHPSHDQLVKIKALADGVQNQLLALETAPAEGRPAAIAAYNAALAAFNAYETTFAPGK